MSTPMDCARVALGREVDDCEEVRVSPWRGMVEADMRWLDGSNHAHRMHRAEWLRLIREALAEEAKE
jgi:hypothetical protein